MRVLALITLVVTFAAAHSSWAQTKTPPPAPPPAQAKTPPAPPPAQAKTPPATPPTQTKTPTAAPPAQAKTPPSPAPTTATPAPPAQTKTPTQTTPPAQAGSPPAPAPGAGPAKAPAPAASQPPAVENYTYQPEGRRDPFLSLVGAGSEPRGLVSSRKGDGPAGMTLGEISVRGIVQSRGALVAMVQGPDQKTYIVHQGDKLLDGTIKTITPQGLIVIQEVNDPLSLVKQREVRKLLRSLEDAKE